jgi:hypothetical protein
MPTQINVYGAFVLTARKKARLQLFEFSCTYKISLLA